MNVALTETHARRPKKPLPAGAIDCHAHIFDHFDRYPLAGERKYQPPPAPREAWLALLAQMGVARGVQVHSSPYGFDNSITEDFIKAHAKQLRAVAVIHPDIDEGRLRELDQAGFRGARLMDQFSTGATTAMLEDIARRIEPYGWHIEINITRSTDWVGLESRLRDCPVPLLFDHLGRVRGSEGVDSPGFAVVRRLLADRDDCWVKISSWYRLSDSGAPDYADMRALVQTLLALRPDRCVWGSNWPHSGFDGTLPDDVDLVDQLDSWLPNDAVREALYVTNPQKLYRFEPL